MEIREKGRKGRGRTLLCILLVMLLSAGMAGCGTPAQEQTEQPEQAETESKGILTSAEEIGLQDTDGNGKEYVRLAVRNKEDNKKLLEALKDIL